MERVVFCHVVFDSTNMKKSLHLHCHLGLSKWTGKLEETHYHGDHSYRTLVVLFQIFFIP